MTRRIGSIIGAPYTWKRLSVGLAAWSRHVLVLVVVLGSLLTGAYPVSASSPADRAAVTPCTYIVPSTVEIIDGADNYAQVQPGDTLCLPAGTRGNIQLNNLNGAAGSPITLRNEGGTVLITGKRFATGGIGISNSSYLRITGSGVREQCGAAYAPAEQQCGIELAETNKGIRVDTTNSMVHHFEIDHVHILDATTDTDSRGIAVHPVQRQVVPGFYVHHNYLFNTKGEAIYVGAEPHDQPFEVLGKVEDVEVSYNLIEQIGYDGIKIKVAIKNVQVHHNVVRNTGLLRVANHMSGILLALSVGDVYNNFVDTDIQGIWMDRALDNPQTRYFNNVVVGAETGISVQENDAQVYNNTVVRSGIVGIHASGKSSRVYDNIVVDTVEIPIKSTHEGMFNNLVGPAASVGFVDATADDYRLLTHSRAVNAGRPVSRYSFPPMDHVGTSRPQGHRTDLGAYEAVLPVPKVLPHTPRRIVAQ